MIEGLTVHGGRTEVFKGPELSEVFTGAGLGNTPNPYLKPESGYSDEIGLRIRHDELLGADSLSASLTLFRTRMKNRIEEVDYPQDSCAGRGCLGWYDNTGAVTIKGFEAGIRYLKDVFSAGFSYAKSDSGIDASGATLEREVGNSIGINFDYAFPQHDLALSWTSRIVLKETASSVPKSGYDVHNISARWEPDFARGASVTLGVDNLFDKLYVSHASRVGATVHPVFGPLVLDDYEPGRNIKATLSYQF